MNNVISLVDGKQAEIIEDQWLLLPQAEVDDYLLEETKRSLEHVILPLECCLAENNSLPVDNVTAVSISNDTEINLLKPWLDQLSLIVLDFPKFTDGRAYTQAVELRRHYGWQGDIRANGDVLRDQLSHMHRCGFSSFAIREDKDAHQAIKGLAGISILYANSTLEPEPLFRRRLP